MARFRKISKRWYQTPELATKKSLFSRLRGQGERMDLRTQEKVAVVSATRLELRGVITTRQGVNQGNMYPSLSFFPSSNLPVSAISQTKLEACGKKELCEGSL